MRALAPSAALALLLSGAALAQPRPATRPDPAVVARRLAELRAETSRLDDELRAIRAEGLAEVRGLADQKAQLQARLAAEDARRAEAEARLAVTGEATRQQTEDAEVVRSAVASGVVALRKAVAGSLPYRLSERLAVLDDLSAALEGGRLSSVEVAARLWRFADDELRLTSEIAQTTLPVTVAPGQVRLLDALRLGMVAMYTLDPKGEFGALLFTDGAWRWRPVADEPTRVALTRLFADRARKITQGVYRLPLPDLGEVTP